MSEFDKSTEQLGPADALDGTELVHIVQDGVSVKSTAQAIADLAGESGAINFTGLNDAPSSYTGQANKIVSVKEDESGLQFTDASAKGSLIPDYGQHLHWRILVHAVDGGNRVGIQEIEFKNTSTGSDMAVGGTASASSATQSPNGAFDDAIDGAWFSDSNQPIDGQWIAYQFPEPVSVRYVTMMGSQDYPDQSPTSFEVQYSDDGTEWETAWAVTDPGNWNTGQMRYYHAPIDLSFTDLIDAPPSLVGQAGRMLKVRNDEEGFDLVPIPTELPPFSGADAAKVLTVNALGNAVEWHVGGAGGGASGGGGGLISHALSAVLSPLGAVSSSAYATKGMILDATHSLFIYGINLPISGAAGHKYQAAVALVDQGTGEISEVLNRSLEFEAETETVYYAEMPGGVEIEAGQRIALLLSRTDGTGTSPARLNSSTSRGLNNPGLSYHGWARYAYTSPDVGDPIVYDTNSSSHMTLILSLIHI